jgi:outer membrane lipoprotein-sorting protein
MRPGRCWRIACGYKNRVGIMNKRWGPALALACVLLGSRALPAADRLDDVLAHMDAVAANFKGVAAQVSFTQVTVVVNDKSTQSGGFFLQHDKKGYKVLIEFRDPDEKNILFKDNQAHIYRPKIRQVEDYDVGKEYKDLLEQYLAVGFGGRVDAMKQNYEITFGGDAKVGPRNTVKLILKPKSGSKRQVELWIDTANWLPVQQRSTDLVTKDYLDIVYTNVEPQNVPDSKFDLHMPGNVSHVHPGK